MYRSSPSAQLADALSHSPPTSSPNGVNIGQDDDDDAVEDSFNSIYLVDQQDPCADPDLDQIETDGLNVFDLQAVSPPASPVVSALDPFGVLPVQLNKEMAAIFNAWQQDPHSGAGGPLPRFLRDQILKVRQAAVPSILSRSTPECCAVLSFIGSYLPETRERYHVFIAHLLQDAYRGLRHTLKAPSTNLPIESYFLALYGLIFAAVNLDDDTALVTHVTGLASLVRHCFTRFSTDPSCEPASLIWFASSFHGLRFPIALYPTKSIPLAAEVFERMAKVHDTWKKLADHAVVSVSTSDLLPQYFLFQLLLDQARSNTLPDDDTALELVRYFYFLHWKTVELHKQPAETPLHECFSTTLRLLYCLSVLLYPSRMVQVWVSVIFLKLKEVSTTHLIMKRPDAALWLSLLCGPWSPNDEVSTCFKRLLRRSSYFLEVTTFEDALDVIRDFHLPPETHVTAMRCFWDQTGMSVRVLDRPSYQPAPSSTSSGDDDSKNNDDSEKGMAAYLEIIASADIPEKNPGAPARELTFHVFGPGESGPKTISSR